MMRKKSEDAVSPVIGAMLLLVVTIVIAAVVAVFASGVGTGAEPAPTTVLDIVDIHDTGKSNVQSPGDDVETTVWQFDEGKFLYNDPDCLMAYYDSIGKNPGEAEEAWGNQGIVTYYGSQIKKIYDSVYVDDVAMTHDAGYVYDEQVGSTRFSVIEKFCTEIIQTAEGTFRPVTVTITSSAGDILNLQKLSIKVYNTNGELKGEKKQNTLSGTLSPGDTLKIDIDELFTEEQIASKYCNAIEAGQKVEVFVLYGEHTLDSKEMKVRG